MTRLAATAALACCLLPIAAEAWELRVGGFGLWDLDIERSCTNAAAGNTLDPFSRHGDLGAGGPVIGVYPGIVLGAGAPIALRLDFGASAGVMIGDGPQCTGDSTFVGLVGTTELDIGVEFPGPSSSGGFSTNLSWAPKLLYNFTSGGGVASPVSFQLGLGYGTYAHQARFTAYYFQALDGMGQAGGAIGYSF